MSSDEPGRRSGRGAASLLKYLARSNAQAQARYQPADEHLLLARSAHTVLLVDDQAAGRYAVARSLRSAGFQVIEAGTAAEALSHARSASVVLLDIHLPDGNGVDVASQLKADSTTAHLPIVLTSAIYVDHVHMNAGLQTADAYLVTPIDPLTLITTVESFMKR